MIEIPWLRSDVAANIRNNFAFYFGYERFGLYAACVAAVIVLSRFLPAKIIMGYGGKRPRKATMPSSAGMRKNDRKTAAKRFGKTAFMRYAE